MNTELPLVSIALCTYNGEKYLVQQLDSLLNQTHSNLEIVIVDDASTDGTIELLKHYQVENANIKLILNEQNIGFNKNFKKAIDLCNADLIAISDQDDIWEPNKIELLVANIGDNLLIYHDSAYIDQQGNLTGKSTSAHHRFVSGHCAKNLIYYNCISGHACLFRKELISLVPEFNTDFYYDWWIAYTAACTGRINYTTAKLVKHRKHAASSTGNDKTDPRLLRVVHLKLFLNHPLTPPSLKKLITLLLAAYEEVESKKFSKNLFTLLLANKKALFYVRKRSLFSVYNFILNESRSK